MLRKMYNRPLSLLPLLALTLTTTLSGCGTTTQNINYDTSVKAGPNHAAISIPVNTLPTPHKLTPGTRIDVWGIFKPAGGIQTKEIILQHVPIQNVTTASKSGASHDRVTIIVNKADARAVSVNIPKHLIGNAYQIHLIPPRQHLVTHEPGRVNPRALALIRPAKKIAK